MGLIGFLFFGFDWVDLFFWLGLDWLMVLDGFLFFVWLGLLSGVGLCDWLSCLFFGFDLIGLFFVWLGWLGFG